jgi:hypothetical protein
LLYRKATNLFVIPAKAIRRRRTETKKQGWIPACAGMTNNKQTFSTEHFEI